MKVSVAMTCYNCADYLGTAIFSVVGQTYKNWEIIFVDEIGKLESKKKGLYEAVQDLVNHVKDEERKLVILSVREELEPIMDLLFEIDPQKIWKLKKQPDEELLSEIMDVIEINF